MSTLLLQRQNKFYNSDCRSIFFSIEPSVSKVPDGQYFRGQDAAPQSVGRLHHSQEPVGRLQHNPEPLTLPYPTGPSFLDHLVPHSGSHLKKPEYLKD